MYFFNLKKICLALLLSSVLITLSCSKTKKEKQEQTNKLDKLKAKEEVLKKEQTKEFFESMKSETISFLYNFGIPINTPNFERNNSTEQYKVALNMGISITNAISAVINKNTKEFLKQASYINEYGERLNVSKVILSKYTEMKETVSKKDWENVEDLLLDIQEIVFNQLDKIDMTEEAILIMVSGWVEAIYLTSRSLLSNLNSTSKNTLKKKDFVGYIQENLKNLSDNLTNKPELVTLFAALPKLAPFLNKKSTYQYSKQDIEELIHITKPIHLAIIQ